MLVGVKIAPRIILLFLPVLVAPMAVQTTLAARAARQGIASIAADHLRFKTEELVRFANSQSRLLESNGLSGSPEFVAAAKATVSAYADGLAGEPGERIAAIDSAGSLAFGVGDGDWSDADVAALSGLRGTAEGWRDLALPDGHRVSFIASFPPFGWTLVVSVLADRFFSPVTRIITQSVIVGIVAAVAAAALLAVFTGLITRPIRKVARSMRLVVETGDLSHRLCLPYDDEIGDLGDSFDAMAASLEAAYGEIKHYALEAAIAHRRESRIRNIFQKYVPAPVIERFFASPEQMLVGEDRSLAVLFSDIRNFTDLSQWMRPHEVVEFLNQYFGRMADAVFRHDGVVDKYIGDALMAFFGAPAPDSRSAYHAAVAAFDMLRELDTFNKQRAQAGHGPIAIGIGVNYGSMTIGNIGSDRKMDYTVIGDMVNLASRIEGLTKYYHEPLIVSGSVKELVSGDFPCRLIDRTRVKGRETEEAIYTMRLLLSPEEERAWRLHEKALSHYYAREFPESTRIFGEILQIMPEDPVTRMFLERSSFFALTPPPPEWTGVIVHAEK